MPGPCHKLGPTRMLLAGTMVVSNLPNGAQRKQHVRLKLQPPGLTGAWLAVASNHLRALGPAERCGCGVWLPPLLTCLVVNGH
jgi:hypothetical protein